jgi:ABC-type nitrate/sulfonate/bicarbonate transport system substrate-binding protein
LKSHVYRNLFLPVILVAAISLAAVGASSASTASSSKVKSLTNVSFFASYTSDSVIAYMAESLGYFKKQGLNVTMSSIDLGSSSALLAALTAGEFQFENLPTSSGILAANAGIPIQSVFNVDIGTTVQLAINNSVMAANHIPEIADTPAETLKQFLDLKGTHITIAEDSVTSDSALLTLCKLHNLTCAPDSPSSDINIQYSGSGTVAVAGLLAGKYDGIDNAPPQTVQPNTSIINTGQIKPISTATSYTIISTPAYIKSHAKTVQEVVNALTEAWAYAKAHPAAALRATTGLESSDDITNPQEDEYLYQDFAALWRTPLLLKQGFENQESIIKESGSSPTPVSVTYNQYNAPQFVETSVKLLKLKVPTTV